MPKLEELPSESDDAKFITIVIVSIIVVIIAISTIVVLLKIPLFNI